MADMSSPIPGDDEVSEGSEVDGNVEVGPRGGANVEEVMVDLRGGGDVCEFFSETRRVLFPTRCLCSMKRGMAKTKLVPMNYGYLVLER
jgi:hypothetical protein